MQPTFSVTHCFHQALSARPGGPPSRLLPQRRAAENVLPEFPEGCNSFTRRMVGKEVSLQLRAKEDAAYSLLMDIGEILGDVFSTAP